MIAMISAAAVQYPIGWIADHVDRRYVVIGLSLISAVAAFWMVVDTTPSRIVIGFSVIAAATLPVYSVLAAHANDQLSPGQVVAASGTMAFLLQFGQLIGMLIGPNMTTLAGGRGLQLYLVAIGLIVALIAVARRVSTEAPEETGSVQPMGVLGVAQPVGSRLSRFQKTGMRHQIATQEIPEKENFLRNSCCECR